MGCPECGSEKGAVGRICADCIARKKERHSSRLHSWEKSRRSQEQGDLFFLLRTNIVPLVLVCSFALLVLSRFGVFGWGTLPKVDLTPSQKFHSEDPCQRSKYCVIAYVAPWCPSCHAAVGFLNTLSAVLSKSGQAGMKVIIGMADPGQIEEMAKLFTTAVFYDLSGEFAAQVGIRSVPNVLLVQGDGKIVDKGLPGGLSGVGSDEDNARYYIKNILKLSE